jgi:hypothetical protein
MPRTSVRKRQGKLTRWTPEELEKLKQWVLEGNDPGKLEIPGRNSRFFRKRAIENGWLKPLRKRRWTKEELAKLRWFHKQKMTAKQIEATGCFDPLTASSVQKKLSRLGLRKKKKHKKRKKWKPGEKTTFIAFTKLNSGILSTEQIAKKFDVSPKTVCNCQRNLRIKLLPAEILAVPYTQKKFQRARRKRAKRVLDNFEKYITERENELDALFEKMCQEQNGRTEPLEKRQCRVCGKLWLKHRKFFYYVAHGANENSGSTRSSWYFRFTCKICAAKKAHQKRVEAYKKRYPQEE